MTGSVKSDKGHTWRWFATRLTPVLLLTLSVACGGAFVEVPIETPLRPKLDVSRFQRVLVAGFVAGGTDEIDANVETARLLRSQLRTNSQLELVDADVLDLVKIVEAREDFHPPDHADGNGSDTSPESLSEDDLKAYEQIFADANYWRQLGDEYQQPLIVTGTVHFSPHRRSGMTTSEREVYDAFGRRRVEPVRAYRDREGYVLSQTFIFIDGETGATLHTERHREEILYDASQNTPALSSFFELMDRMLPSFLGTLSSESIRGTRVLLK